MNNKSCIIHISTSHSLGGLLVQVSVVGLLLRDDHLAVGGLVAHRADGALVAECAELPQVDGLILQQYDCMNQVLCSAH